MMKPILMAGGGGEQRNDSLGRNHREKNPKEALHPLTSASQRRKQRNIIMKKARKRERRRREKHASLPEGKRTNLGGEKEPGPGRGNNRV